MLIRQKMRSHHSALIGLLALGKRHSASERLAKRKCGAFDRLLESYVSGLHVSAALPPGYCPRHALDCPKSQLCHPVGWQRKLHSQLLECDKRSSAALALGCNVRHIVHRPKPRLWDVLDT